MASVYLQTIASRELTPENPRLLSSHGKLTKEECGGRVRRINRRQLIKRHFVFFLLTFIVVKMSLYFFREVRVVKRKELFLL